MDQSELHLWLKRTFEDDGLLFPLSPTEVQHLHLIGLFNDIKGSVSCMGETKHLRQRCRTELSSKEVCYAVGELWRLVTHIEMTGDDFEGRMLEVKQYLLCKVQHRDKAEQHFIIGQKLALRVLDARRGFHNHLDPFQCPGNEVTSCGWEKDRTVKEEENIYACSGEGMIKEEEMDCSW